MRQDADAVGVATATWAGPRYHHRNHEAFRRLIARLLAIRIRMRCARSAKLRYFFTSPPMVVESSSMSWGLRGQSIRALITPAGVRQRTNRFVFQNQPLNPLEVQTGRQMSGNHSFTTIYTLLRPRSRIGCFVASGAVRA